LRFPGFEGEWEMIRLGELTKLITKGTTPKKFVSEGVKFIKIECFEGNIINSERCLYIDEKVHHKELRRSILEENDLLFAIAGATIGKTNIVTKEILPANTNQALAIIRLNTNENINFIYQILKSDIMQKYIKDSISVGAQPNLNLQQMNDFSFHHPSLSEQNKISSLLTSIDERIQTQKKIIEDLQITKKEISFKLFKGGFNSSELRKENFQKLGDLTYIVNKKNKENLKLPVYSINNKKGFISQSEQFEGIDSDERGYDISLYKIIEKETFAYNPARINVGSIGYSGNLENIIISSLYVCFKTVDVVDDKFLFHYLRTDIFRKEVLRNVEGGVRDYLFYESFSRIKINLPDLKEQIKIAHFLSKFDEKINLESDLLALYENQKKYLLHNLFV